MANAFGTDGQDLARISAGGNLRFHADVSFFRKHDFDSDLN
jgi:hypothetical protein